MRYFKRFPGLILISFACAFSAGCFFAASPVPAPTRVSDAYGARIPTRLGISSVKPGSTHREEVLKKFGAVTAGLQSKRLFLARWKVSHMAVCWAGGGEGGGDANCRRVWKAHNLIVEFDGQGIVRKAQYVPDRDIGKVLAEWTATIQEPPLDLSKPVHVGVDKGPNSAELTLANAFLLFHYKAKFTRIPRRQILGVNTTGWKGKSYSIKTDLQYRKGRKATRNLRFQMSPPDLLELIEYFEQTLHNRPGPVTAN